jgi:hypothetical protein
MSKQTMLDKLQQDSEIQKILQWPFDFDVEGARQVRWFVVNPVAEIKTIACDGTGSIFVLYGPQQKLFHVTSEGQAGMIARSFEEGVGLIVARPYWRDLLKFSGGGKIEEMRRVAPYLERELYKHHPDIDEQRAFLKRKLSLADGGDVIASLHSAVAELGKGISVTAPDGSEFDSLFNTFTVESNPMWKRG